MKRENIKINIVNFIIAIYLKTANAEAIPNAKPIFSLKYTRLETCDTLCEKEAS